ncbi:hypothetical protein HQ49_08765 [Porphyromonas gulae]|nr:hypothetical protein HQ49_08765 [Porphyromonas gulae]
MPGSHFEVQFGHGSEEILPGGRQGAFRSREDDLHREEVPGAVSKVLICGFLQLANSVKNFLSTKTCGIWVKKVGKNYVEIFPQMHPYL